MTSFEYVVVLLSIVFGLSITRLLSGIGELMQARANVRTYWVHSLWTLNVFLYIMVVWWAAFYWRSVPTWGFFLFLFVMLAPIVLYLITVLLFPDDYTTVTDMRVHFEHIRRWFYVLLATLPIIDFIDTLLKGAANFADRGTPYVIAMVAFLIPSVAGVFTQRPRFHAGFGIVFLIYLLTYIALKLGALT